MTDTTRIDLVDVVDIRAIVIENDGDQIVIRDCHRKFEFLMSHDEALSLAADLVDRASGILSQ